MTTSRSRAESWLRGALRRGASLLDADRALQASTAGLIELAASRYALGGGTHWRPGEPLQLLFAGYTGTRNTGADVRVEEMIRQFRFLLGDDLAALSIFTINPEKSRGYFQTVRQVQMPEVFPKALFDEVGKVHGVVTCEGSMFKSKFASALSTMMAGALGVALAENKPAIAYGGEAGAMDPSLARLVSRYCRDALVITRNTESRTVLSKLGVPTRLGTDTAWTFDPAPASVGRKMLSDAGWDGQTPVLAVCPINPFWWPVRPDIGKAVAHWSGGMHADAHYKSIYFHHAGSDVDEKQDTYLRAIATAVNRFRAEQDVFVVCVGMEQLDRKACSALSPMIDDAPLFISDEYDMYEMVSLLRQCGMLVSSRYHAIVTSMPGGVPSAGITMDERIRNLMRDRNQPELALEVDSPDLAEELLVVLRKLHAEGPEISEGIARCVHLNLERMGVMGQILVDYLREQLPGLPLRPELGEHGNPWHHLPPLSDELQRQIAQVSA